MRLKSLILGALLTGAILTPNAEARDNDGRHTFLLTGASFAIPENGWFEIGCEAMDAKAINKSVSGEAIYHTARRMASGTFYSLGELDDTDVFVIGHVHNQNVANEEWLKENWQDYTDITTTTNYATTYDYVIKRYIYDCAQLEFNPDSKYYGVEGGKPVKILFCTHWHDSRTTYNLAIRKLSEKWGYPLVEFDTNIGFSKDDVQPDEPQPSLAMAHDTEKIDGVTYGWHPLRGDNSPIQRRMADIFVQKMSEYLDLEVPFEVTLYSASPLYLPGDEAHAGIAFKGGMFPYSVDYTLGSQQESLEGLEGVHVALKAPDLAASTSFKVDNVSDASGKTASVSPELFIPLADSRINPDFSAYVHEAYKENTYGAPELLQLKKGDNWSRMIYLSFPVADIPEDFGALAVRLYFDSYTLGTFNNENRPMNGIEPLYIEGNTNVYTSVKWSTSTTHQFEPVSTALLTTDMKEGWVGFDVTDWAREKLAQPGIGHLTFRIYTTDAWKSLMNFVGTSNAAGATYGPQLLVANEVISGVRDMESESFAVSGSMIHNPGESVISVYRLDGALALNSRAANVDLSSLPSGCYIIKSGEKAVKVML